MMGTAEVIRADSRHLPLEDDSVDLVVTSPPYFALRSYQDEELCLRCIDARVEGRNLREMWPDYDAHAAAEHHRGHYPGQIGDEPTPAEFVDSLLEVTAECVRVLKPSGSLWVNLGDKYASNNNGSTGHRAGSRDITSTQRGRGDRFGIPAKSLIGIPWRYALRCIDELGLILRAEVIWSKPNGLPESVTDRVRRSHEQWFHFTLEPRYFSAVDEIREKHAPAGLARRAYAYSVSDAQRAGNNPVLNGEGMRPANALGKLPGSVWSIPTEALKPPEDLGVDHFAAFPTEWPKRIISGFSPVGVCVECGEGRRPVVSKEGARPVGRAHRHLPGYRDPAGEGLRDMAYAITGYACACNEPIATPTGAGQTEDPSQETGRGGFNRPRGADAGVRIITRWEQRHEAEQLSHSEHADKMALEAGSSAFAHYLRTDRSGARAIPEALRVAWRERGWLTPAPEYVPADTTPAVVLDPFGGTGTTAMVAKALGRHGITVDMSADYCRLAEWRTNDTAQLAKVLDLPKPKVESPDQVGFDFLREGAS